MLQQAAKYCDVVSVNMYTRSLDNSRLSRGKLDVPLLESEISFTIPDGRGFDAILPVTSEQQQTQSYENFTLGVLRNPAFVGAHWFAYRDEPCTGRCLDGENAALGFVDITDTPKSNLVEAARKINYTLYQTRLASQASSE